MTRDLNGLRILVIEDEPSLAFVFKMMLEEAGGEVIGPANSIKNAFDLLKKNTPDCAIMDVRLDHETAFPVADQMAKTGIPFAFVTGNSAKTLPHRYRKRPCLLKPVNIEQLIDILLYLKSTPKDVDGMA